MVQALKTGLVSVREFWELTIPEIDAIFEAHALQIKEKLTLTYNQASLIATFTALATHGKDLPPVEDIFPDIFDSNETDKLREQKLKAMFTEYALAFNERRAMEKADT